ncbi:ABC transporter ATP-binding protein [Niveispirillum cyanobacteriorum]|uniref:Sugar ABC transporter n=1 Tax=Niveispirillum cyanobacteriorum TaxID=1612173 RepID=A0A2K9NAP0_9PROT|nr:sn-glycerol-3-phosphate ABC transporter ATP-binding protein UgpC [Niveispirillum cyanobacteriorum]AUN30072.1 sugar ABC transporter [Niveispirillum cyanobacteriorum]GGE58232.1 sugar ABC transporter ATP-binding protein [Niveispirillum cyanobacteriorum]
MQRVHLQGIAKNFGGTNVLEQIDLTIEAGEFLVLLGPSGCGKSTLLNIVAGLEEPTGGRIHFGERDVTDLEPDQRDIAMVFQSYALYPTMSVRQNIGFALKMRGLSKVEIAAKVAGVAKLLQIEHLLDRKPSQLSGGQQQRVAIGRALVREPQVFLLDEPLSNLDAKLRADMRVELKRLHERSRRTTLYVTHDQVEAMTLASRIVVMNKGRVQQCDRPEVVYAKPANRFVAGFVGAPTMNFLEGELALVDDGPALRLDHQILPLPGLRAGTGLQVGQRLVLGLRPEHLSLAPAGETGTCEAQVVMTEPTGPDTFVLARLAGREVTARMAPGVALSAGQTVGLHLNGAAASLFDTGEGVRLN